MKIRILQYRDVIESMRFDGSYHNADVNVYDSVIKKHSHHKLSHYCSEIFSTGRNKRTYTTPEFGYPFLSNSDVVSAEPFMSCKYCSRKYDFDDKAVLKTGMILTGRVGAIGQTSFVPSYLEKAKAMGSDNIIRIVVKSEYRKGFIYAYLSSKMGQLSFWKYATGGVQPFITETMVGSLPVPNFPEAFQKKVDDLIQESAKLREEASIMIETAKSILLNYCNADFRKDNFKTAVVKNIDILSSLQHRIDPPALINDGVITINKIKEIKKTIKLKDTGAKVFRPGIFKRCYVSNGYPYIKGSDIFNVNPFVRCSYLSKKNTPFVNEMQLHEGQILVTCAGSVGNIKLITKEYDDKEALGSQDIIRIETTNNLFTKEYLFIYLQLPFVYDYIQSMKYGSVIERVEPFHIESIPVVQPTVKISEEITSLVRRYMECTYKAFVEEETAIKEVEQEIESWNKK